MMKRIALALTLVLAAHLATYAQETKPKTETKPATVAADTKTAALPTVDEVIDKYVKALGGKEALEKVTSRSAKGTMEVEGMNMSGAMEMAAKAPNKATMSVELVGFGKINNSFDGTKGYASDPMSGVRELSGAELEATRRDSDFYAPLRMKQNFTKLEVKGKEKVGSADTYVIVATPTTGEPEKYYFDITTGLLVRHDITRDTVQGKMTIESYLDDYRAVDGTKVPFALRQVTPAYTINIKLTDIKHNTAVEETKFGKPSGN